MYYLITSCNRPLSHDSDRATRGTKVQPLSTFIHYDTQYDVGMDGAPHTLPPTLTCARDAIEYQVQSRSTPSIMSQVVHHG